MGNILNITRDRVLKFVFPVFIVTFIVPASMLGQSNNSSFKIGGVGRGNMNSFYLAEKDTVNPDAVQYGNALLDLGVDGTLNPKVEINGIIRLYTDLTQFFDEQNSYLTIRQIQLKARINKNVKFEFGDLDFKLSPYTLWNTNEEGYINESALFSAYRDIARYENFNTDNHWRQQGMKIFGKFSQSDSAKTEFRYYTFMARLKSSDGVLQPNEFMGGGRLRADFKPIFVGINYINFFNSPGSIGSTLQYENYTTTAFVGAELDNGMEVRLEAGLGTIKESESDGSYNHVTEGEFFDLGVKYPIKDKFQTGISVRSVSDDFFSAGAQSKRIDYNRTPVVFPTVTNEIADRSIGIFDVYNDYTLYQRTMTTSLGAINPLFGTAIYYGKATPNRQGITLQAAFKDTVRGIEIDIKPELLQDVTGEGTLEKRQYLVLNASADMELNKTLDLKNNLKIHGGVILNNAARNDANVDPVSLISTLIDAGLEASPVQDFNVLLGAKMLTAKGLDYLPVRGDYNEVVSYDRVEADWSQAIYALGAKYDLNKNAFLQLQYQWIMTDNRLSDMNYNYRGVNVLFNLRF